jgi:hypothetical protein
VDDVKTALEVGQKAQTRVAESDRLTLLEKAAKDAGFKPALLKRLAPNLNVVAQDEEVKGDDGKFERGTRYYFQDGEQKTEVGKFFEGDDETLALLKDDSEELAARPNSQPAHQTGTRFVEQGGPNGKPKKKSAVAAIKERNEAKAKEQTEGEGAKTFLDQAREAGMTR